MRDGVAWVTAEVPDRELGGGNQRQAYLLEALAQHVPIDLLVAGRVSDERVRAAARRVVEVDVTELATPAGALARRARAATVSWLLRQPLDVHDQAPVRAALAERLRDLDPSVVLVHHQGLAPLLGGPRHGRARWALHLFHAAGERADQLAAVAPHPLQRALLRRDGANARAVERHAVERADVLVVATDEDAVRLAVPGTPTVVVPQGVDLERFRPSPLPVEATVVFTGSLDYEPNVDGITWFVHEVWPTVRRRVPAARLLVVGRQPAPAVRALAVEEGVELHADVPAIAPWLAAGRVAVAPLRVGTGVRVKAVEALAAGRPLVATSVAMEGIAASSAEVAIADDAAAFAAAVVALLRDSEASGRQAAAGRAFVERCCSWAASADRLAAALT